MTILTSQVVLTIGDASVETVAASITVLPVPILGSGGTGRLIHPTLGTYDYPYAPDEWTNINGDVVVAPIWSSSKTLSGASNTLFAGNVRDTTVSEKWTSEVSMPMDMVDMLLTLWQNPPNPSVAHVHWYPNYTTTFGYKVILMALNVNGEGLNLNFVARQGWINGDVELKMKVVAKI